MAHNEGAMNLLKQDVTNKLNYYNKVIPYLSCSKNDLIKKAESIENKLNANKNGTNDAGAEGSKSNKSPNSNEKQNGYTKILEFDNFRQANNYIPKIHINKHKVRDKDRLLLPFSSPKEESYKGIMSLYDNKENKCKFYPTQNLKNPITLNEINEIKTIQRNDTDYDYTLKPNFYTNRYIEYLYEDRGDKLYEENNVLKNLFDKNPNRDSKNELNFLSNNSPYLKAYNDLIEKEREEIEKENKEMIQSENIPDQVFTLNDEEKDSISSYLKNNKDIFTETTALDNYFKLNMMQRGVEKEMEEVSPETENDHDENKEKIKYEPKDISFEIDVQGEITKKIRNSSKKQHPRGMVLHGPIAYWYRINEDHENTKLKGYFDIRNIDFKPKQKKGSEVELKNQNLNSQITYTESIKQTESGMREKGDHYQEEFVVKDVFENNKLNKKDTIFTSRKIVEFGNKTFKYFFHQLQKYFLELLTNIEKTSYSVLKFLSDTNCTSLELSLDGQSNLIEYIFWHTNLQILSISSSYINELKNVMSSSDWECKLQTLTITKSVSNSGPNTNDNPEDDLKAIFENPASVTIQNIHFVDFSCGKKLIEALYKHIDTFYSDNICTSENKICNISPEEFKNLKKDKLPIINLSFKKTPPNMDSSTKADEPINIKGIYYLLMYMLAKALEHNNYTLPEVFNKLDLSESNINEDLSYLVKIITKFKIIKELDISNTRYSINKKVIFSKDFLSNIKLTDEYYKMFDQEEFYNDIRSGRFNYEELINNTENKEKNNGFSIKLNSNDDDGYDYSMEILPILEKIYIHNTDARDAREDIKYLTKNIYLLFKRLKFFRGIYYSDQTSKSNQENIYPNYFCEELLKTINEGKKAYSENVFQISND